MTLWAEIFSTSAVSSTLSPPKNQSSMTFALAWVDLSQSIQCFVNGDNFAAPGARGDLRNIVQIHVEGSATPFGHALGTGLIHENARHHVCRYRK
jgi:hypothetical protein